MKYIVAKIHNNSLNRVIEAMEENDAKGIVRQMAEKQLGRPLNQGEVDDLENRLEITNEEDADNIWCFSIGII